MLATIILWLFVLDLAIALGAGLYESRVAFPLWLRSSPGGYEWDAEAARAADSGLRFWVYVTTVPLTLLTLASAVAAWWTTGGAVRVWWLAAVGTTAIERALTFTFFIPTMVRLMSGKLPQSEAVARALLWGRLSYVRHALGLIALLAALKALSSLHPAGG